MTIQNNKVFTTETKEAQQASVQPQTPQVNQGWGHYFSSMAKGAVNYASECVSSAAVTVLENYVAPMLGDTELGGNWDEGGRTCENMNSQQIEEKVDKPISEFLSSVGTVEAKFAGIEQEEDEYADDKVDTDAPEISAQHAEGSQTPEETSQSDRPETSEEVQTNNLPALETIVQAREITNVDATAQKKLERMAKRTQTGDKLDKASSKLGLNTSFKISEEARMGTHFQPIADKIGKSDTGSVEKGRHFCDAMTILMARDPEFHQSASTLVEMNKNMNKYLKRMDKFRKVDSNCYQYKKFKSDLNKAMQSPEEFQKFATGISQNEKNRKIAKKRFEGELRAVLAEKAPQLKNAKAMQKFIATVTADFLEQADLAGFIDGSIKELTDRFLKTTEALQHVADKAPEALKDDEQRTPHILNELNELGALHPAVPASNNPKDIKVKEEEYFDKFEEALINQLLQGYPTLKKAVPMSMITKTLTPIIRDLINKETDSLQVYTRIRDVLKNIKPGEGKTETANEKQTRAQPAKAKGPVSETEKSINQLAEAGLAMTVQANRQQAHLIGGAGTVVKGVSSILTTGIGSKAVAMGATYVGAAVSEMVEEYRDKTGPEIMDILSDSLSKMHGSDEAKGVEHAQAAKEAKKLAKELKAKLEPTPEEKEIMKEQLVDEISGLAVGIAMHYTQSYAEKADNMITTAKNFVPNMIASAPEGIAKLGQGVVNIAGATAMKTTNLLVDAAAATAGGAATLAVKGGEKVVNGCATLANYILDTGFSKLDTQVQTTIFNAIQDGMGKVKEKINSLIETSTSTVAGGIAGKGAEISEAMRNKFIMENQHTVENLIKEAVDTAVRGALKSLGDQAVLKNMLFPVLDQAVTHTMHDQKQIVIKPSKPSDSPKVSKSSKFMGSLSSRASSVLKKKS